MTNSIPRCWPEQTVVCIASGPSLTEQDVNYVEGKARVIAVNDAYRLAPWADVLYAADHAWWAQNMRYVEACFTGDCWTQSVTASAKYSILKRVQLTREPGISHDPMTIHSGGHSGYQALNLAYLMGANRIILLGYDCQRTGGEDHWFGRHEGPLNQGMDVAEWARAYDAASDELWRAGITVVNCSRESAITAFVRVPIEAVLRQ
jgi:hypothetical protein